MKKYLAPIALIVAGTSFAQAMTPYETLLITFGEQSSASRSTHSFNYLEQSASYNVVNTTGSAPGTSLSGWVNSAGTAISGLSLNITGSNCGAAGRTQTIEGTTTDLYKIFDQNAISGTSSPVVAGVLNNQNNGNLLTFSGLTAGDYKITIFSGRGNNWSAQSKDGTFSITGSNVTVKEAKQGTSSGNFFKAGSPQDNQITVTFQNDGASTAKNWGVMEFVFSAQDTFTLAGNNVGAIALTAIPEPSMFGLLAGMGALALVSSRRRRK